LLYKNSNIFSIKILRLLRFKINASRPKILFGAQFDKLEKCK